MISASAAPAMLEAAAPAPAAPGAAPALTTTGLAGTAGPAALAPGFDAILMLQNLAGTAAMLETGVLEAGDTADLLAMEETEEDEEGDDIEASLAFLSALIAATTPRDAAGDLSSDAGGQGTAEQAEQAERAERDLPARSPGELLVAATQLLTSEAGDSESGLAAALAPVKAEPVENRGDNGQTVNRAAEMMTQMQRAAIGTSEKPVVNTHVRDPRWAEEMGNRVALMVRAGESTASLQLTPVDLGPVEVNVTVRDGQASIHFGATQAETRQLLEASLPRLREMLAAQGFGLLDASVSSGFSRSQHADSPSRGSADGEAETSTTEARPLRSVGLLDLYA